MEGAASTYHCERAGNGNLLGSRDMAASIVGEGERAGGEHDDVAEHAPATSSTIRPAHDDGSE